MVYVWSEWKERTTKAFSWTLAPDTSWPPVTHATTSISPRRRTLHLFSSKRKSTIRDFPSQASMTPPPDYRCTASLPAWVRPTNLRHKIHLLKSVLQRMRGLSLWCWMLLLHDTFFLTCVLTFLAGVTVSCFFFDLWKLIRPLHLVSLRMWKHASPPPSPPRWFKYHLTIHIYMYISLMT